jgi:hypothetical protein
MAYHHNAHPNNFIVLNPLKNNQQNILGLIDLDNCYEWKSYVNNKTKVNYMPWGNEEAFAKRDKEIEEKFGT